MSFESMVDASARVDVTGWDFSWLAGRATEERPPWGYSRQLATRLAHATRALDLDTGGGEIIAEIPTLPPHMTVTEGWAPNVHRARTHLPGVNIVHARTDQLPFATGTFDLVTSRHPVRPAWTEIARVLAPGGTYFAQHVGPRSAFELIEVFLGPLPPPYARDPHQETTDARAAGLDIVNCETARCRMEFHDIGAIIWTLRKCVWWVPDFSVERYETQLRELHTTLSSGQPFVAHSTRTLIEARLPHTR